MSLARSVALKVPALREVIQDREALRTEVKRLNRQNAKLERRVETLQGDVRLLTEDRDRTYDYVFVVTYGRSGSTLLQGLLNSIPGYLIRGENAGTIESLYENWRKIDERLGTVRGSSPRLPWYGVDNYSGEQAAASYRRHVLEVLLKPHEDTRVTGFKEIRWWRRDLVDTLNFTRMVFPGARFVLNTRDVEHVIRSKWWADKDPEAARRQVADYDARLERAHAALPEATYRVHYDDYVADHGVLEGMYDWLGEPFDRARVDEVMDTPHSF